MGAVPSIILAVGADLFLVRFERRLTPWSAPERDGARRATA